MGERSWFKRMLRSRSITDLAIRPRGWYFWHHHMSLEMAQLFMLEERLLHQETKKLLSTTDITILLKHYLPRRDVTEEEVLRQLRKRHRKRQSSTDAAYRKQADSIKYDQLSY